MMLRRAISKVTSLSSHGGVGPRFYDTTMQYIRSRINSTYLGQATPMGLVMGARNAHTNSRMKKYNHFFAHLQTKRKLSIPYVSKVAKMYRKTKQTSYVSFILGQETRLDVILVRLHFCESIRQARQLISHGKVYVNNGIVNINRSHVSPGDVISFVEPTEDGVLHTGVL